MATQSRLLTPTFHLDTRSREAGKRGIAKARAALAHTRARSGHPDPDSADRGDDRSVDHPDRGPGGDHATAA